MSDVASWVSAATAVVALVVSYLVYLRQRSRTGLEYVVVSNTRVVPRSTPADLQVAVTYKGSTVADASVVVVRIVNTGDKPILAEDFTARLAVRLSGAQQVVSAIATSTRPRELEPRVEVDGNAALIAPLLINPTDMIELQLLASGRAGSITLEGRIVNVRPKYREDFPYPPGTGPEGELSGSFEWFMWYVAPVVIAGGIAGLAIAAATHPVAKLVIAAGLGVFAFVLNPAYVRYLVRRRAIWAP